MLYAPAETTPVVGLRREIDRLLQGTSGSRLNGPSEWAPAVDIRETKHELTFAVELPGIKPEAVEVTAQDHVLMIRGERAEEEGEEGRYHLVERNVGAKGKRTATGTYRLSDAPGGGTRIEFEYAWEQLPLSERLAAPMVRSVLRRANQRAMERLAQQLSQPEPGVE